MISRKWGIGLGIFVITCFVFLMAFFALSGCATGSSHQCDHQSLESVVYDPSEQTWTLWFVGPYDCPDLHMARVPMGQVDVKLRVDGGNCTTVKLHGNEDARCRYRSATIFVPTMQKYEELKKKLSQP